MSLKTLEDLLSEQILVNNRVSTYQTRKHRLEQVEEWKLEHSRRYVCVPKEEMDKFFSSLDEWVVDMPNMQELQIPLEEFEEKKKGLKLGK